MRIHKPFLAFLLLCTLLFSGCSSSKLDAVSRGYMKDAFKKFTKGDFTGQINSCRLAINHDPKNDLAYALIGDGYASMNKWDTAVKEYDTACNMNAKRASYRFYRAYSNAELKNYDSAIADYNFAIKNNFRKPCAYNNKALINLAMNRLDSAQLDYNGCLASGFYYHRFVLLNKADVYLKQKKYSLAMKMLDDCIKADPLQLSFLAHSKGILTEHVVAKKDILLKDSSFINEMSKLPSAYILKGTLSMISGRYKQALKNLNYEHIFPLSAKSIYLIQLYKGQIAFNTLQYDTAMNYYNAAIEKDSTLSMAYLLRGSLFSRLKQYQQGAEDFKKAIRIDSSGYANMGLLNIETGKYDSAISCFSTAIKKSSKDTVAISLNNRGYAYFLNKQFKEAIADYDSAIKLSVANYQPYFEYKQEALDALENKGGKFCTLIHWQAPVNDVNDLVDSARFYVGINEQVIANFKITTNHPIEVDRLFLMINGASIIESNRNTVKIIKEDKVNALFEYEYPVTLNLPKGKYVMGLDYDGKQSQRMEIVVE